MKNRWVAAYLALASMAALSTGGCSESQVDPTEVKAISNQKTNNPDLPTPANAGTMDDPKSIRGKGGSADPDPTH